MYQLERYHITFSSRKDSAWLNEVFITVFECKDFANDISELTHTQQHKQEKKGKLKEGNKRGFKINQNK